MGQFISKDSSGYVTLFLPGPMLIFKFLLIAILLLPWIFIISNRINLKDLLEFLFMPKFDGAADKKSNGFF